ncbi:MAG TPA: glycosyltransferase family 4 protein [Pseudolabrys sp.]|jgi:glycosyltransferase involved in cell wall biosynthesis|nr:glycosyltransferase family 4 protein [Pseudolabrys sp.]
MRGHAGTVFVTGGADVTAFSGSSYYLTESLRTVLASHKHVQPISMHTYRTLAWPTLRWGLRHRIDPRKYFFMVKQYQEANFVENAIKPCASDTFLSFPAITPKRDKYLRGFKNVFLFIDLTLGQYLGYEQFNDIPDRIRKDILAEESESYRDVDRIFVFSDTVAQQLSGHYSVDPRKIQVIGRGLNIPTHIVQEMRRLGSDVGRRQEEFPLRIGFVGVDFKRKGLLTLVEAVDSLPEEMRSKVELAVIGPDPDLLPKRPYLTAYGYMDKKRELERICRIMAECDLGYLYSKSEGIAGSVLEFLSLGVPCIVSDIPAMQLLSHLPGLISIPLSAGTGGIRDICERSIARPESVLAVRSGLAGLKFDGWMRQATAIAQWC